MESANRANGQEENTGHGGLKNFKEQLLELIDTNIVTTINIVGVMGTGKTNWIHYLANLHDDSEYDKIYIQFTSVRLLLEKMLALKRYTRELQRADNLFIAFDDLTFGLRHQEENTMIFATLIARIRHKLNHFKRFTLVFVYHYSKALIPFLRLSHIRILTSITCKQEISSLKEYFDLEDLWNFYEIKTNNLRKYYFHSLVNLMSKHYIVKPPLAHDPLLENFKLPKREKPKEIQSTRVLEYLSKRIRALREKGLLVKQTRYYYIKANGKLVPFIKRDVAQALGLD